VNATKIRWLTVAITSGHSSTMCFSVQPLSVSQRRHKGYNICNS